MSVFTDHYKKRISKIEIDIEHINRHLETAADIEEKKRLKLLKQRLLEDKYNYIEGLEAKS